jgi:hypothetical protein
MNMLRHVEPAKKNKFLKLSLMWSATNGKDHPDSFYVDVGWW